MFSVGQKVVLVDDKWPETVKQLYLQLPVLDTVYVVRAVRVGVKADELIMDMRRVLEASLLLVGIYNPTNNLGVEAGFAASRFRALDELKKGPSRKKKRWPEPAPRPKFNFHSFPKAGRLANICWAFYVYRIYRAFW